MSRSAEEQQLLEQKIQAMKQKNEELRRRHLEVEADKQSAAKQNALVKTNVPLDDDWVPGRHVDSPRHDRHQNEGPLASQERDDDQAQRYEQRRHRNDGRDDNSQNQRHFQNSFMRKSDHQGPRQRPDSDRFYGNENRRSGEFTGRSYDASGSRSKEWMQQGQRGGHQSSFPSKVFKNSSMESDRSKRPGYRLAEGDGPPPDPSYSFLGDSMRDSPESVERKGQPNRRGFQRGRGRGVQTWNNRNFNDFRKDGFEDGKDVRHTHSEVNKRQSDDAWRRERNLIDQERINRQKTSDGNWSREWDNHKILQEGDERPNRWRRSNQTPNYDRGHPSGGFQDESGHSPKLNYSPRNNTHGTGTGNDISGKVECDESSKSRFIHRGRFSNQNQNRFKDNTKYKKESVEKIPPVVTSEMSKEVKDAMLIESHVKSVEKLQVSVVMDPMGSQKRCVEGVGGNLLLNVSQDAETSDFCKNVDLKRPRKTPRKTKRNRVLSTTSTGTTTGTAEDDGSWEDLSSDEEEVSTLTELQRAPHLDLGISKSIEVSSGPESLDPIPAPGKEDEFLWDDFHPAGFQDNATLDLDAEAAYQALLDEQAKQEVTEDDASHSQKVSFRLDTSCLDDSSDELDGAKLDPLLVTTQIVQAEVDCMSFTSIPTDTSLPEDLSQIVIKTNSLKDEMVLEESASNVVGIVSHEKNVSAEELSGPVSILDVPSSEEKQNDIEDSTIKMESIDDSKSGISTEIGGIEIISQTEKALGDNETPNLELDIVDTNENDSVTCLTEEPDVASCRVSDNHCEKADEITKENDVNVKEGNIHIAVPSLEMGSEINKITSTIEDSKSDCEIINEKGKETSGCLPETLECNPLNKELVTPSEKNITTDETSSIVTVEGTPVEDKHSGKGTNSTPEHIVPL